MNRYLIRLDDACPTMDARRWQRIEDILDQYDVKPMVGVIPHNEDEKQMIDEENLLFWEKVDCWKEKGWAIALHGFNHCYTSTKGLDGLNPLWVRSEFAGLSLVEQKEKIRRGVDIMRMHGIDPKFFFAPSHTFDKKTLIALREESNIRIISDTIATKPYRYDDFIFIPQLGGHCTNIPIPGIWTFCLHPSVMSDNDFALTEEFLRKNRSQFMTFDDINTDNLSSKSLISRLLSWAYFTQRKIRRIK